MIIALGIRTQHVGLTAPGKNVRSSLGAVLLLGLASCLLGFIFQPSAPNLDTLAFQALMPSLAEELAYRGSAPALLLGLYREKETPEGIPWVVVLLTALTFGVCHGLGYRAGSLKSPPLRTARPRPAGRVRSRLPHTPGGSHRAAGTHTNQSPMKPGPFIPRSALECGTAD